MKKRIVLLCIIAVIVIGGLFTVKFILSFHKVSLKLVSGVTTVQVYSSHDSLLKTVNASRDISLQNGSYYIKPSGNHIDISKINFTVNNKDTSITINPDYSTEYLASLLKTEASSIQQTLTSTYGTTLNGFYVNPGYLYQKGGWYGTTLTQKVEVSGDTGDVYRIILQKKGDAWAVITKPQLVLSSSVYRDTPVYIVNIVNNLPGDQDKAYSTLRVPIINNSSSMSDS